LFLSKGKNFSALWTNREFLPTLPKPQPAIPQKQGASASTSLILTFQGDGTKAPKKGIPG
jgi:hypothetical protein